MWYFDILCSPILGSNLSCFWHVLGCNLSCFCLFSGPLWLKGSVQTTVRLCALQARCQLCRGEARAVLCWVKSHLYTQTCLAWALHAKFHICVNCFVRRSFRNDQHVLLACLWIICVVCIYNMYSLNAVLKRVFMEFGVNCNSYCYRPAQPSCHSPPFPRSLCGVSRQAR